MTPVVHAQGLSKAYGDGRAVDALDLRVGRGEIYAFLGPNGAGRITTIRMRLGMIRPSAGSVALFGEPVGPSGRGPRGGGARIRTGEPCEGQPIRELQSRR
jgi:ABC-2 type transport system ATP-binding protein